MGAVAAEKFRVDVVKRRIHLPEIVCDYNTMRYNTIRLHVAAFFVTMAYFILIVMSVPVGRYNLPPIDETVKLALSLSLSCAAVGRTPTYNKPLSNSTAPLTPRPA